MEHSCIQYGLPKQAGRQPIITCKLRLKMHTCFMGIAHADVNVLVQTQQQRPTESLAIEEGSSTSQPGLAVRSEAFGTLGCVSL